MQTLPSVSLYIRIREYWLAYYTKAGTRVESYSVLREFRELEP